MKVPYNHAFITAVTDCRQKYYIDSTGNGTKFPKYSVYKIVRDSSSQHPLFGNFSHMIQMHEGFPASKLQSRFIFLKGLSTFLLGLFLSFVVCNSVLTVILTVTSSLSFAEENTEHQIIKYSIVAILLALTFAAFCLKFRLYYDKKIGIDNDRRYKLANEFILRHEAVISSSQK